MGMLFHLGFSLEDLLKKEKEKTHERGENQLPHNQAKKKGKKQ